MSESPQEHLLRVIEETLHRRIDRLDREIRTRERKAAVKRAILKPLRWLYDGMTGR